MSFIKSAFTVNLLLIIKPPDRIHLKLLILISDYAWYSFDTYADILKGTRTLIDKGAEQMYIEIYADSSVKYNVYF